MISKKNKDIQYSPRVFEKQNLLMVQNILKKHFKDLGVAHIKSFEQSANKTEGLSTGCIVKRQSDRKIFMLKQGFKSVSCISRISEIMALKEYARPPRSNEIIRRYEKRFSEETLHVINEFVTAALYKRLLYDRTPEIELVVEGNELLDKKGYKVLTSHSISKRLYIRSKYLNKFKSLYQISKRERAKLQGFEKVIAACLILGESDTNNTNLGFITEENSLGREYIAVKIDHGKSATLLYKSAKMAMKALFMTLNYHKYIPDLKFNLTLFKDALIEMTNLSDNEIDKIIENRIHILGRIGFNPKGIFDEINNINELADYYKQMIKNQVRVMKNVVKILDLIARIDIENREVWLNGKWIKDIQHTNPLLWAIENYKSIDGQEYEIWKQAIHDAVVYGNKIEGYYPLTLACKLGIKINGVDPIKYAILQRKRIQQSNPLTWAFNKGKKIEGLNPAVWGIKNNLEVDAMLKLYFEIYPEFMDQDSTRQLKEEGLDLFGWIIKEYSYLAQNNNYIGAFEDNLKKLANSYESLIFFENRKTSLHNRNSYLGDLVFSYDLENLAQTLDKQNTKHYEIKEIAISDIRLTYSLDVIYRMKQIGEKLQMINKNDIDLNSRDPIVLFVDMLRKCLKAGKIRSKVLENELECISLIGNIRER